MNLAQRVTLGPLADGIDHAARLHAPIQQAGSALEHFKALVAVGLQAQADGAVAALRQPVDDGGLAGIKAANEQIVKAPAAIVHGADARHSLQRLLQIARLA